MFILKHMSSSSTRLRPYSTSALFDSSGDPSPSSSSPHFTMQNICSIYNLNTSTIATSDQPFTIAVVSLGGGLFGNIAPDTGVLTNGDVQAFWLSQGIAPAQQPTVRVVFLDGATNATADFNATVENTIDVETIGVVCPLPALTIVLFIAPNTMAGFYDAFNAGITAGATVISCSWGGPERYLPSDGVLAMNTLFQRAAAANVNIFCASGDYGSSDGVSGGGVNVDFPASSPYVVSCGGTLLVCPSASSYADARETAWTSGGGGVSAMFARPAYQQQQGLGLTGRAVPDVSLNADPASGVYYLINGRTYTVGGTSIVSPAVAACLGGRVRPSYFLNTKLYSCANASNNYAACFHDVRSGSNGAYSAGTKYDLCTGWGSFDGAALALALGAWVSVAGVTIDGAATPLTMIAGRTPPVTLHATVTPSNASNTQVTWSSSAPGVATVNASTGVVTAVAAGHCSIAATTLDGGLTASRSLVVTAAPPPPPPPPRVTSLQITSPSSTVRRGGGTMQCGVTVQPPTAVVPPLLWHSNNPSLARVTPTTGLVTTVGGGVGVFVLTVTTADAWRISASRAFLVN
jgi:subtilase family serine protease